MSEEPSLLSRPLLVVAVGLPLLLAVAVALGGRLLGSGEHTDPVQTSAARRTGPLPLVPVDAPDASSAACTTLLGALPASLVSGELTLNRRELATPAPLATAGWGDAGHDPVILRCGLGRPVELSATAELRVVSGVHWLPVPGDGATTWYLVDRSVYVAVTVPDDAGTGPLQDLSTVVGGVLPATP